VSELPDICEDGINRDLLEVERSMCYHGLGHLNMYITKASVDKAIELCEVAGKKPDGRDYLRECYQAVFMQIFQPLEPEDFALVKDITPSKESLQVFCSKFEERVFNICYREGWPLFKEEIISGPVGINKFCSYTDSAKEFEECRFYGISVATISFLVDDSDYDKLKDFCLGFDQGLKDKCFGEAAIRSMRLDSGFGEKAIHICDISGVEDCYAVLIRDSSQIFIKDSREFYEFCNLFNDLWSNKCYENNKVEET
jgi:hypothetical protein